jgi:transcriptional regulator with XRE-family HTH domain
MRSKHESVVDRHIGSRMRKRRMALGLSQQKLGDAVNITIQQIQKYEKGTNRIGGGRLLEFARMLSVDVGYFFEGAPGYGKPIAAAGFLKEGDAIERASSTKAGIDVLRALNTIKRPKLRQMVVEFAERLAAEGL